MKNWLNYDFWFQTASNNSVFFNKILLFIALSLIVISFFYLTLMAILFKNSKACTILRENIFYFLFFFGFFLLTGWFFRYQQVVYLGARITFLVIAFMMLGWLIYLAILVKRTFIPLREEEKDWQRKEKYLPKSQDKKFR